MSSPEDTKPPAQASDGKPRLRGPQPTRPLHIVLVEPEIPPNTGNIARLAAATCSALHLVGRLGFRIDDQAVRRAGLDYWHLVDLSVHASFDAFLAAFCVREPEGRLFLFTAHAARSYLAADFRAGDALVFGKESSGLSPELVAQYTDRTVGIPTLGAVRSLNLANAASVAVYEALRQTGALSAPFQG